MTVQKAIFPGVLIGIFFMIGLTSILAANSRPALAEPAAPAAAGNTTNIVENANQEQPGACSISNSYPESIQQWCGLIEQYARESGLDPNLVSAVMLQESAGAPDAYSKSGAVGLLQVMPRDGKASGFMCPNGPCFADRPSMEELFDPEYNIAYGTRMLSGLINKYGSLRDALKAYGPKDVGYYYADIILGIFNSNQ